MQRDVNIDHVALATLAVIGVGWFFMTTLVVDFGLWQESVPFYDVWAVIQDPGGRLSGINRSHPLTTLGFGLVCAAAIFVPALAVLRKRSNTWLTYFLPFTVMTITCAVLYTKSSTTYFSADTEQHSLRAFVAHIAQSAVARAGDTVASRISIGAGAYVAALCSCFLVVRGLRMLGGRAGGAKRGAGELATRRQRDADAGQIEP
jgi:hypothetical protein